VLACLGRSTKPGEKKSSGSHGAFACVCVCVGMSGQIYQTRWKEIKWTQHCGTLEFLTTYLVSGVVLVRAVCVCEYVNILTKADVIKSSGDRGAAQPILVPLV
jgi:DMSO reductase anchor subunit